MNTEHHLQAIITVLSLVNPAICGAMFLVAETGRSRREQRSDAAKAALAVLVLLALAALCGIKLLHVFGVSLDAFSVAGGGVLAWMGFTMLRGQSLTPPAAAQPGQADKPQATPSLTPLILFAASPGTITGVITLSIAHTRSGLPTTALVAVAVATGVLWLTLLFFSRLGGAASGGGFVRDTVTRFMGLIVIAMGTQFALTGIRSFMLPSGQ